MTGGGRALGGVALDPHRAGHDVLGDAPADVAVHRHLGLFVHAGHEVAGVAQDVHRDGRVEPHGQAVPPLRVGNFHALDAGLGQVAVQELVDVLGV